MTVNIFAALRAMSAQMDLLLLALAELTTITENTDDLETIKQILENVSAAKQGIDELRGG